jgi:hypothetical protein
VVGEEVNEEGRVEEGFPVECHPMILEYPVIRTDLFSFDLVWLFLLPLVRPLSL